MARAAYRFIVAFYPEGELLQKSNNSRFSVIQATGG
jgi:hypothetical protein